MKDAENAAKKKKRSRTRVSRLARETRLWLRDHLGRQPIPGSEEEERTSLSGPRGNSGGEKKARRTKSHGEGKRERRLKIQDKLVTLTSGIERRLGLVFFLDSELGGGMEGPEGSNIPLGSESSINRTEIE